MLSIDQLDFLPVRELGSGHIGQAPLGSIFLSRDSDPLLIGEISGVDKSTRVTVDLDGSFKTYMIGSTDPESWTGVWLSDLQFEVDPSYSAPASQTQSNGELICRGSKLLLRCQPPARGHHVLVDIDQSSGSIDGRLFARWRLVKPRLNDGLVIFTHKGELD